MKIKNYKTIIILLITAATLIVGITYVGALNGWFGGGAAIPEDTMTRGLVGYWNMDEGAGQTAKDLSGNSNNGTLGASASPASDDPKWTKGKNGGALKFDGVNDYVSIGDVGNVRTIEFWLNDSSAADGILELINNTAYISISGSAVTATGFTSATVYVNANSGSAALGSGWNHIAITDTADVAAAGFLIGEANGDYMSGIIDEVRVYNRALSAEEVRYHYNRGGPVAEWKFDEGSGTTIYDSTENNKDGVLHE